MWALTLQPVCCWKGVTQSTVGSSCPASAYPAQTMMLRAPSPAPIFVSVADPGGPADADPPAAIPSDAHPAVIHIRDLRPIMLLPPIAYLVNPSRAPWSDPVATRGAP